jgi:hypothetical protein
MKTTIVVCLALSVCSGSALACEPREKLAFACTTVKGKRVEVCSGADTLTYAYGRPGAKPELSLRRPKRDVKYEHWSASGEGGSLLTFRNGNATYTVTSGARYARDYGDGTHEDGLRYADVSADVNGRNVASNDCRDDTIREDLDALGMKSQWIN